MEMYRKIEKQIFKQEHLEFHHVICDICKKENNSGDKENYWAKSGYDVKHTIISNKAGSNYPDFYYFEEKFYTICPECFESKIVPFLESLGAKHSIRTEDGDVKYSVNLK